MTPEKHSVWMKKAQMIQEQVAAEHNLTRHKMVFSGSSHDLMAAKRKAMHRCRTELGMSYPQIGEAFNCHHTTVMHHLKGMDTGDATARLTSRKAMLEVIRRQAAIIHQQAEQIAFLTRAYGDVA
jgi:chromosomal replication initiation ATPase DnaA